MSYRQRPCCLLHFLDRGLAESLDPGNRRRPSGLWRRTTGGKEMKTRGIKFGAVIGLAAFAVAGVVSAQVVVQPSAPPPVVVEPAPSPSVTVQPAPAAPVVVQPTVPQVVQAGDIEATEVRAQTIYANKIKAGDIRGTIHQTRQVKVDG